MYSPHPRVRAVTNEELLALAVDILAPAAVEGVLTLKNTQQVSAKFVLEMANGAIDEEAEKPLISKGIEVVPDVVANGGGVATSYLEWVEKQGGEKLAFR